MTRLTEDEMQEIETILRRVRREARLSRVEKDPGRAAVLDEAEALILSLTHRLAMARRQRDQVLKRPGELAPEDLPWTPLDTEVRD